MSDLIERQAALKTIGLIKSKRDEISVFSDDFDIISRIETMIAISNLPFARPDNKVNLCDSCKCNYPDCPSKSNDVILGNGNDNICACNKYEPFAQPERQTDDDGYVGKWVKEEDILKFYYVESLDDYWIGRRLAHFYYATWDTALNNFVWSKSRYLPWGEHVISPDTLWKEHTYPSEPKEIPFVDWLKGFYKKYFIQPERQKGEWIPVTAIHYSVEDENDYYPHDCVKWVDATEPDEIDGMKCSECGTVFDSTEARNWCSECGADMRDRRTTREEDE